MTGRRAPIIAGVVMAAIAVLLFLLVVNPKRAEVAEAQGRLETLQAEEITLVSEKATLEQAKAEAPANRSTIRRVEQQLPPTADPQGFILLLEKSADKAGVELTQSTIGTPLTSGTGVTAVPITMSLSGTYFALDEYLFQLETLPRAAKVISVSLAPGGAAGVTTLTRTITMQLTTELYTTDASAGPGSDPGPTEAGAAGPIVPVAPIPSPSPSETG